jgi:exonuclease V gamma subunit
MKQRRVFSASDLAQFEYCPLAWWYEEVSELAQADAEELARRLEELEDEYPSLARAQPEYQVIERLLERTQRLTRGRAQQTNDAQQQLKQPDSPVVCTSVPRLFGVIVVAFVVLTIVLLGLGLLLWVR